MHTDLLGKFRRAWMGQVANLRNISICTLLLTLLGLTALQCVPEERRRCRDLAPDRTPPASYPSGFIYSPNCTTELTRPQRAFCLEPSQCADPEQRKGPYTCVQQRCVQIPLHPEGFLKPGQARRCFPANTPTVQQSRQGTCQPGQQHALLRGTRWSTCMGSILPKTKQQLQSLTPFQRCMRADEDCNGQPDADAKDCACDLVGKVRVCYPGSRFAEKRISGDPKDTATSACFSGIQRCEPDPDALNATQGTWGPCKGYQIPSTAACSGRDGNCDGTLDQPQTSCFCTQHTPTGFVDKPATEGSSQQCLEQGGLFHCRNLCDCLPGTPPRPCAQARVRSENGGMCETLYQRCEPSSENGLSLWSACIYRRQQGRYLPLSISQIAFPRTEFCNGLDDDCDGTIDNLTGHDVTYQEACFEEEKNAGMRIRRYCGIRTCEHAKLSLCNIRQEICNGKDDDCDGFIDNIQPCAPTPGIQQRRGYIFCLPQPNNTYTRSKCRIQEICNNRSDDDNDGNIDNTPCIPPLQQPTP
ncbi:MAG: MopE-related protein [Myxococcota bacterium]